MKEKTAGQSPAYLLSEKENSPPVVLLSAGQLVPFPGHPFRVEEDGELEQLTLLYQQDNTPEDGNDHCINSNQYGWIPYKSKIGGGGDNNRSN
jgi:hypothetical protein